MANKTIQVSELSEGKPSPSALRLIGSRSGMLTIAGYAGVCRGSGFMYCRCDCGKEMVARVVHLSTGRSRSCGCVRGVKLAKFLYKHGFAEEGRTSRVYRSWRAMRRRCSSPIDNHFDSYGGRGITVCKRWDSFENFLADMGEPPPRTSIDRIDNNGNYEPGNCRWATNAEQARNQRSNWRVSLGGVIMTAVDAAEQLGIKPMRLYKALYKTGASKAECIPVERLLA